MAGFGIQKKGTSKILMKRTGFVEGGNVNKTFEKPVGKISPEMAKELEMAEFEIQARSAEKNLDEFNRKMEGMKTPKQRREEIIKNRKKLEEGGVPQETDNEVKTETSSSSKKTSDSGLQFRCGTKGKRKDYKKGGSVKKGILIVIGEKDKKMKRKKAKW